MKARRQMKILEIIREQVIETQEDLARQLSAHGIEVTQATVSRDIKELQLLKIPSGDGKYRYGLPSGQPPAAQAERMRRIVRECVTRIDWAENIVVIRSLPGTGAAVGEALDSLKWAEIVGTVAGDNTVIVIIRNREAAIRTAERLRNLMQ